MAHGICVVPVMPLRAEPSHQSEMISQLLFGEAFSILDTAQGGWIRIRNQYDHYEGWVTEGQTSFLEEEQFDEPTVEYTGELLAEVMVSGHPMHVPLGSFLKGMRHGEMQWGKVNVVYKGKPWKPDHPRISEKLIREAAFPFLNTAYLWGGRSAFGLDCSGFSQTVYRLLGHALPRDAWQQAACGEPLSYASMARCGDLAFFENDEKKITHVGIMLNEFEIIHAAGKVHVDKLDGEGIIHAESGQRTHRLAMIRRYF